MSSNTKVIGYIRVSTDTQDLEQRPAPPPPCAQTQLGPSQGLAAAKASGKKLGRPKGSRYRPGTSITGSCAGCGVTGPRIR